MIILTTNPGAGNDLYPNLLAAYNSSLAGDEVVIPAGTFTMTGNLNVTRNISLTGLGTIIKRAETSTDANLVTWGSMITYNINSTVSGNIAVSNITFKSRIPSITSVDGLSLSADVGLKLLGCVDFRVYNCGFENFGKAGLYIQHDDDIARGVVYNCNFLHNAKGIDALGEGYGILVVGMNTKWITNAGLGSSNFIFIEDNKFDYHRHSIAAGGCALYVARYNHIINNYPTGNHAIDTHAPRGPGNGLNTYGSRATEAYNNLIVNTTFRDGTAIIPGQNAQLLANVGVLVKSGDNVTYNNHIVGFRFGTGLVAENTPIVNAWFWNNIFTPYVDVNHSSSTFYNFNPEVFTLDVHYHLMQKVNYSAYQYPHPARLSRSNNCNLMNS